MAGAVLLRRQGPHGRAEIIPRDQWSFANCPNGGKGTPSKKHICLPAGFSTDYIYQLIYEAQDPNVQGLGFAATRDVISFLRHDTSDDNPLVITDGHKPIHWTMAFGSSQSGRFLRHFLYEGFNEDVDGRTVLDGMMPHIAGGRRGLFNQEFAQTTRYSRATEEHFHHDDGFPVTYEVMTDPITGKTDGLLARCRRWSQQGLGWHLERPHGHARAGLVAQRSSCPCGRSTSTPISTRGASTSSGRSAVRMRKLAGTATRAIRPSRR